MLCSELGIGFILDLSESTCNLGFPVGSVSKVSAFNAGDLGSIPELGKSWMGLDEVMGLNLVSVLNVEF